MILGLACMFCNKNKMTKIQYKSCKYFYREYMKIWSFKDISEINATEKDLNEKKNIENLQPENSNTLQPENSETLQQQNTKNINIQTPPSYKSHKNKIKNLWDNEEDKNLKKFLHQTQGHPPVTMNNTKNKKNFLHPKLIQENSSHQMSL